MFGNLLKRFKVKTQGLSSSALSASENDVLEAMIAVMVRVAYADGTCSNKEVDKVNSLISSNPQLREFRNEPVRLFNKYCDQMETSLIQGRKDMDAKIALMSGDTENSERVLIAGIEVASAGKARGDEDNISMDEDDTLSEIAKNLDLKLGKYI